MPAPIRRAGPADASAVAALLQAFGDEFDDPPDPGLEERVPRFLEDPRTTFLLAGDPPHGIAVVRLREAVWIAGTEAWLEELYVAPPRRGRGHGRALLQAAIAAAREQGAGHFELTTTEEDAAAAALYRAEGLRETEYERPDSGRVIWFGLDL